MHLAPYSTQLHFALSCHCMRWYFHGFLILYRTTGDRKRPNWKNCLRAESCEHQELTL
jgi:hypothetical protein